MKEKQLTDFHKNTVFNAAKYLFVSMRLAEEFPDNKASKLILEFSTPWPRQSYQYTQNVSNMYNKKHSSFLRGGSVILFFLITNMSGLPSDMQDFLLNGLFVSAGGGVVYAFISLYSVSPFLVCVPVVVLLVAVHWLVRWNSSLLRASLGKESAIVVPEKGPSGSINSNNSGGNDGQHVSRRQSVQMGINIASAIYKQDNKKGDGESKDTSDEDVYVIMSESEDIEEDSSVGDVCVSESECDDIEEDDGDRDAIMSELEFIKDEYVHMSVSDNEDIEDDISGSIFEIDSNESYLLDTNDEENEEKGEEDILFDEKSDNFDTDGVEEILYVIDSGSDSDIDVSLSDKGESEISDSQ
jgi:hypothetical protein